MHETAVGLLPVDHRLHLEQFDQRGAAGHHARLFEQRLALDHLEVQVLGEGVDDLLVRYAAAIDGKDWKLLDTCFLPDAHVDYTATGGIKGAYPEVRKWLEMALAPAVD